ncbi:MAG: cytochrome c oxidase subunit II [Bacteriovoracaceae bacterium]|jgi:cytochrome c oxidase subunit II|nr:cytochrome c oxidase subunit II [Bacteriovoracaceae bacterium]
MGFKLLVSLLHVGQVSAGMFSDFITMLTPPEDISTYGHKIMFLFNYITVMNVFYFTLVCIGLFGFSYLYSAKRNKTPEYTYGNRKKQLKVTLIIGLAVFCTVDSVITVTANNDLVNTFWKFPESDDPETIKVQVLAQQWMWHFRLAGNDKVFNTDDDIVTANHLHLPIGKKIVFQLTSKDVIHSFFLPNARVKIDAMPGRISRIWVEFTKSGDFEIACAEMCGTHHYLMKAKMTLYDPDDFQYWESEAAKFAYQENDTGTVDSYWGWKWESNR